LKHSVQSNGATSSYAVSDVSYAPNENQTGPTTNLVTVTTTTSATLASQNPATNLDAQGNLVSAGYAISDAAYSVQSIPAAAGGLNLDGTSVYQAVIGGATTNGIRAGNLNLAVGLDGQYTPIPTLLTNSNGISTINPGYVSITTPDGTSAPVSSLLTGFTSGAAQNNHQIYVDPLILDLNGGGVSLTSYAERTVLFDIDHDGSLEQTGWVAPGEGIVVIDRNGNGKIDDISETLSEYYGGAIGTKPYANGFDALKSLDSNHDNQFTSADTAWNSVKIWIDANADGRTDPGELKTLDQLGITSINLNAATQSGLVNNGNEILASGSFTQTVNGTPVTREALAASFIANPAGHIFQVTANGVIDSVDNTNGGQAGSSYATTLTTGANLDIATLNAAPDAPAVPIKNLYGNSGNDTLTGDANANWLAGGLGADTLNGGAGDDVILFDSQDTIDGGDGNDVAQVVGDQGVVLNLAQTHIEAAIGGRGDDILIGGGRSSVFIEAGAGDDIVIGGAANDVLSGEDGNDLIDGGAGNDLIRGHRGQDQLMGGAGDDILEGGQDDDQLNGGSGNDVLKGEQGDDFIDGGDGTDVAKFSGSYAEYRIIRTGNGIYVADTVAGRDGTDFVKNVETLSFRDIGLVDANMESPLPVKDMLSRDANGNTFDRSPTARTISAAQLLGNDLDWQSDTLHITAVTDVQGGSAILNTTTGNITFTPSAGFTGIMGFKYTIADSKNNLAASVSQIGTTDVATMKAAVYLLPPTCPATPAWWTSGTSAKPTSCRYGKTTPAPASASASSNPPWSSPPPRKSSTGATPTSPPTSTGPGWPMPRR